jgi:hypothetical protein
MISQDKGLIKLILTVDYFINHIHQILNSRRIWLHKAFILPNRFARAHFPEMRTACHVLRILVQALQYLYK